jgi:nitrogen-specific signal transduction histidine kinase
MGAGARWQIDEPYRLFVDKICDGIILADARGTIKYANPAAELLLDCGQTELLGQSILLSLDEIDFIEVACAQRDGTTIFVELRVSRVDWQGEPAYMISMRDTTRRKKAAPTECAQRQTEFVSPAETPSSDSPALQQILDSMTEAVVVYDQSGRITSFNAAALRLGFVQSCGASGERSQHLGLLLKDPITPLPAGESPIARALRGESTGETEFFMASRQDALGKFITQSASPMRDSNGSLCGCVLVARDITDRKHQELIFSRNEKLVTVGRMAATLAHEINNPLDAMMNALFLISLDQSLSDSSRKTLKVAEIEVRRIANLTQHTLGFRSQAGPSTSVDITGLVDDVLEMYNSKLENRSVRVVRKHSGASHVQAIEGELRQIVCNLVTNGIDAVPPNGSMFIRTAGPIMLDGIRPMMRITVADSGTGICQAGLQRIFEAFYTTKESVGTGLGLWATSELVRKYKGKIRVRSCVGRGSVFTVWIPTGHRGHAVQCA